MILLDSDKSGNIPIVKIINEGRSYCDTERRLVNKNGQAIRCRLIGNMIKTGENRPYSIIIIDDISERKETEKYEDAFIDMVAHELMNPLMAVVSSLRLAKREGHFPDILDELIGIASDGAESLWAILGNMLEVSRAKAERLKLTLVNYSMEQLINDVLTNTRQTL
jgi:signal transduction histidine kinase